MQSEVHGIARAAVLGGGLMGRRIAGVLCRGGIDVTLYDVVPSVAISAAAEAHAIADLAREPGKLSVADTLEDATSEADLVKEVIIEDLGAKQDLIAAVTECNPRALVATNTSVLPVTKIAETAVHPERVLGTHWWNPPDLIPIVEVVPGARTAPETVDRMVQLLQALDKTPVRVCYDIPGFIGNRLQHAMWREAIAMVASGVCDATTLDLVVRGTIGLRLAAMGPIENADYVGLDMTAAIHEAILPSLDCSTSPNPLLRELISQGRSGAKVGHGFLEWPVGTREDAARRLDEHLRTQLANHRHLTSEIS